MCNLMFSFFSFYFPGRKLRCAGQNSHLSLYFVIVLCILKFMVLIASNQYFSNRS